MAHRLRPLVEPASIAVVGASRRHDTVGNEILVNLNKGRFAGPLYAVNPRYDEVLGVPCYPALENLPEAVEHVIFAVSDERIEAALKQAVAHGARAVTIFSTLVLEQDSSPLLIERIRRLAQDNDLLLAGGNGMGFYNFRAGVWACGFDTREHEPDGNTVLLSQSGSGMSAILDCDERLRFSFAASSGQELVIGVEDYLDYVLDQAETRVVGLFLETSRKPEALLAGLDKARRRGVPVVALKVGRTELAARLAVSHSGALAGNDAAYDAVFDHFAVQRVRDLDELATTLIMFAQPHEPAAGGLVTLHDSGGERQLLIDQADALGVPLTTLSDASTGRLQELLDPGLPATNPLDAWSAGGTDYHRTMQDCMDTLMSDPQAALGAVIHARAPFGELYESYFEYLEAGHRASGKPVFLVAARQGTGQDPRVLEWTHAGYPVLDGVSQFLVGARCMLAYRDALGRPPQAPPAVDSESIERLRVRLESGAPIDELEAGQLLAACGIPILPAQRAADEGELLAAARALGYPVVLKTAASGVRHKTEHDGVYLQLDDEPALREAYRDLRSRLGPRALLAPMHAENGVEMILGIARDRQFGPLVVLGFGGVQAELLGDVVLALPPFGADTAQRCLDRLRLRPLLDENRGRSSLDLAAYCDAAACLSVVAAALRDYPIEVDINPLKVTASGCVGLDALIALGPASDRVPCSSG